MDQSLRVLRMEGIERIHHICMNIAKRYIDVIAGIATVSVARGGTLPLIDMVHIDTRVKISRWRCSTDTIKLYVEKRS